jgi:hypothetical protein
VGGFFSSKTLEEINKDFPEYSLDAIYEIVEQAIEMTKVFETGNFTDFLAFYKLFNKKAIDHFKGVPMSDFSKVTAYNLRPDPPSASEAKAGNKHKWPANHNDIYKEDK